MSSTRLLAELAAEAAITAADNPSEIGRARLADIELIKAHQTNMRLEDAQRAQRTIAAIKAGKRIYTSNRKLKRSA